MATSETGPGRPTRQHLDSTLASLQDQVVEFGGAIIENCELAFEALLVDSALGAQVEITDRHLDKRYAELETKLLQVMAREQPFAHDLRFLLGSARIVSDLERAGDYGVNIARALHHLGEAQLSAEVTARLRPICDDSISILRAAIDAYAAADAGAAARLVAADDQVDQGVDAVFDGLLAKDYPAKRKAAMVAAAVVRHLERLADHGVNIAEHVRFIETGVYPETGT